MDLLLTHGFFLAEDPGEQRVMKPYPPLGILYISAFLKQHGVDVGIFDSTFALRSDFESLLRKERPGAVGIYANMLTRVSVLELIKVCGDLGIPVVVGGPDPANYAEEYLEFGADVVVIGEGEETLLELLPELGRGSEHLADVRGIAFSTDGGTFRTESRPHIRDLDSLPFPDRDAIPISRYLRAWKDHHGRGALSLITARGCPYTCRWCSHSVFGYSYRTRTPGNVADEIEFVLDRYKPEMLWYADDVFTIHRKWLLSFHDELQRRRIKIPFETISREDRLDEEIVETLASMGCYRLWIGSESGSQTVLDAMDRRTNAVRVREMVACLQRYGIRAGMFIMLGYEGERPEDIQATVDHVKIAAPDDLLTTIAYPIKGTPYYEAVQSRISSPAPWHQTSDRKLTVRGRASRRYYDFANRWLVSEHRRVQLGQRRLRGGLKYLQAWGGSGLGRLGMWWTKNERESGFGAEQGREL